MTEVEFPVKTIRWSQYEQLTPILLQEANGPCPLIALVNTMLLRSDIEARTWDLEGPNEPSGLLENSTVGDIPTEGSSGVANTGYKKQNTESLRALLKNKVGSRVLLADILGCLGDMLLDLNHVDSLVINTLLENLPLLHTGLDVNPNLVTGGFPDDMASQIFSVFNLNFVHAWCWEPCRESPGNRVFQEMQTYDGVHDYLLGTSSDEDEDAKQSIRMWLEENSTQLTPYGLQILDDVVKADLVAVFFRNNHFSTLYKASDHGFYLLITDTAFLKSNKYVWQSLNSASGAEDLFFTGEFLPIVDSSDYNIDVDEEDDMRLLQELQQKEDSEYAKRLQKSFDSKAAKGQGKTVSEVAKDSSEKATKDKKEKKSKKKGTCVIC